MYFDSTRYEVPYPHLQKKEKESDSAGRVQNIYKYCNIGVFSRKISATMSRKVDSHVCYLPIT